MTLTSEDYRRKEQRGRDSVNSGWSANMQLCYLTTGFQWLGQQGSRFVGFQLMMANLELSLTTTLRRDALSVRRFRHGRRGESLEARVVPDRIEHGIEPEQRRSERRACGRRTVIRDRQKFLQSGNGAVRLV